MRSLQANGKKKQKSQDKAILENDKCMSRNKETTYQATVVFQVEMEAWSGKEVQRSRIQFESIISRMC